MPGGEFKGAEKGVGFSSVSLMGEPRDMRKSMKPEERARGSSALRSWLAVVESAS